MKERAFHPEAAEEYAQAAEHYGRITPGQGMRFYDQIEGILLDVRRQPPRFRFLDPPIRRHFFTVFPYAVLYVDQPERVLIIAVMPMNRRPGYWQNGSKRSRQAAAPNTGERNYPARPLPPANLAEESMAGQVDHALSGFTTGLPKAPSIVRSSRWRSNIISRNDNPAGRERKDGFRGRL